MQTSVEGLGIQTAAATVKSPCEDGPVSPRPSRDTRSPGLPEPVDVDMVENTGESREGGLGIYSSPPHPPLFISKRDSCEMSAPIEGASPDASAVPGYPPQRKVVHPPLAVGIPSKSTDQPLSPASSGPSNNTSGTEGSPSTSPTEGSLGHLNGATSPAKLHEDFHLPVGAHDKPMSNRVPSTPDEQLKLEAAQSLQIKSVDTPQPMEDGSSTLPRTLSQVAAEDIIMSSTKTPEIISMALITLRSLNIPSFLKTHLYQPIMEHTRLRRPYL